MRHLLEVIAQSVEALLPRAPVGDGLDRRRLQAAGTPRAPDSLATAITSADEVMYPAKDQGKNRVFVVARRHQDAFEASPIELRVLR